MAQWTTAFINNLPDSSFLYIEPGGSKDSEGKTTPRSLRHFPVKDGSGNIDMPHLRNALARIPQSNLSDAIKTKLTAKAQNMMPSQSNSAEIPKIDLVRALPAFTEDLFELRDSGGGMPTLAGHFAVFDDWAEINSNFEGHFLERISPTAFNKTFKENRRNMRVLFQHGKDPQIGEKVLGPITDLRSTQHGAAYEVPLFDTSYNHDLIPGLREGQYGSSFRFSVVKEDFNRKPEKSDYNPTSLPERTIEEARVSEFGPVTFPAYAGADAGL